MNQKNVLIIGAPRSGTTLLSGLLTGNEECFPNIPECTYITQSIEHYFNIINYHDEERFRVYAKDNPTLLKVYKKHVQNMLSIAIDSFKEEKYQYLVLKDPELTKHIDLINDFFGADSKIVFIARDPRSIIASMFNVEVKKNSMKVFLNKVKTIEEISSYIFNYYYIVHTSRVYSENLFIIKYEDMISDNKEVEFLRLEKYLGYKFNRTPFIRNCFKFDKNDPTYSDNYGKAIVDNQSNFYDVLSKKNVKFIEQMFGGINQVYRWW